MKLCTIHQPNFFPWTGYFDKIRQADIFIFLDDVAYPKSGSGSGSWCNRVKLMNSGQPTWYGLPIKKESGVQIIKDVVFHNRDFYLNKLRKSLYYNYNKSLYYEEILTILTPLLNFNSNSLAEYNMHAITMFSEVLGLKTRFIKQSDFNHSKKSTELLIELSKLAGADAYLCGNGAQGYQDDTLFEQHNIQLVYQNYNPSQDSLLTDINPIEYGMSILNSLFKKGIPNY